MDAGADAAVVEDAAVVVASVDPAVSAPVASTVPVPVVVVHTDAGAKHVDAGVHDAAAPVVPDAGKIPTPTPSGLRVPTLPSGLRIPSGIPSRFLPH